MHLHALEHVHTSVKHNLHLFLDITYLQQLGIKISISARSEAVIRTKVQTSSWLMCAVQVVQH